MSSLNEFINQNKEEFDSEMPSAALWENIASELPAKKKVVALNPFWMRIAASVVFMLVSLVVYEYQVRDWLIQDAGLAMSEEEPLETGSAYYSFKETEAYYVQQVNVRLGELNGLTKDYPDLEEDIAAELQELDEMLTELKAEIENGGDAEIIVNAMLKNYKMRVLILEDIIETLKDESHEMEI